MNKSRRTIKKPTSVRKLKRTLTYTKNNLVLYFPVYGYHHYWWLEKNEPLSVPYIGEYEGKISKH